MCIEIYSFAVKGCEHEATDKTREGVLQNKNLQGNDGPDGCQAVRVWAALQLHCGVLLFALET